MVMAASPTLSMLPQLRQRAFQQAISAFDAADLTTPAGRERIVHDVTRAYADYERRMLPPTARPLDLHRIRAIVRVALRDIVAACA
jgi:hypothetical protein